MKGLTSSRIWIAPLVVAVVVAVFGWWCNRRLREIVETQLRAELTTTLEANVTALDIWMTNQVRLATAIAAEPEVRDLALRVLVRVGNAGAGSRVADLPEATDLEGRLRPRLDQIGYGIAHVVSTNLTIVGGSIRGRPRPALAVHDDHVAKFNELFATGQPVVITPFKPQPPRRGGGMGPPESGNGRRWANERRWATNRPPTEMSMSPPGPPPEGFGPGARTNAPSGGGPGRFRRGEFTLMQVAVPLRDEQGELRGALALVLDPDREFTRILSVARWGQSGETYAFDQRGRMISRSRFDDQLKRLGLLEDRPEVTSALNLRLSDPGTDLPATIEPEDLSSPTRALIKSVARAVTGESGVDLQPTRDYRGVPVIAAWRWLPEHGFGVATQRDATEAYRTLRVLNLLFLILFLLLLLCATGLLLASQIGVLWRRQLTEAKLKLRQLGQYTLEEKIGEGGMGVVYRARHALLRRDTAVKLLLPDRANPEAIGRFEREVCLSCRLAHPNTIQVYDYGRTPDGIFYYAMEYLQGLNLQDLVRRFGPQPEGRVVHLLDQVCGSLSEAHAVGLVHRDVKPANVFVSRRGGVPDCVKVLDFGLVRDYRVAAEPGKAEPEGSSTVEGTPSFMPPEAIVDGSRSDPRSDLYSVGALGYFLLTGYPVFEADSVEALYEKQLRETPVPPSERTSNPISKEMEAVILRCLAKSPVERPASAEVLRAMLASTPRAGDWGSEARSAWWQEYEAAATPPGVPDPRLSDVTTRVDVALRPGVGGESGG